MFGASVGTRKLGIVAEEKRMGWCDDECSMRRISGRRRAGAKEKMDKVWTMDVPVFGKPA